MDRNISLLLIGLLCVGLAACGDETEEPVEAGDQAVTLNFKGTVGDRDFACGQSYTGIGTSGSELTLHDFRLYIHGVRLVTASGQEVPVALDQASPFQFEDVVLLDFEDATGPCANGTAEINTEVTGTVPAGQYAGVRFTLGVPFELNHGDATLAPSPLNLTTMFWSWAAGYKFMRVDGVSTGLQDGLRYHLGSTGCEMNGEGAVTSCANPNRAEIALDGFDVATGTVAVDMGALLATSDIDTNTMETPPGCMSAPDDPECAAIFSALGIGGGDQTFFRAQ